MRTTTAVLLLFVVLLFVSVHSAAAGEVRVGIAAMGGWDEPREVLVTARPSGQEENPFQPLTVPGTVPGTVTLDLPAGSTWSLSVEAEDVWSAGGIVFVGPEGASAVVAVWPTGRLVGSLILLRQEKRPETLTVSFQPDPTGTLTADRARGLKPEGPTGEVRCDVDQLSFHCDVPAGRHDLQVASPSFVSHYRFGVDVPTGREVSLGSLPLRRGASLVGWLEAEGSSVPGRTARIRLIPATGTPLEGPEGERVEQMSLQARPRQRGLFQFEGVPPGRYRLIAEDRGYAPAERTDVDVRPDQELILEEPLVLKRPRPVVLSLEPVADPWGDPWRILVNDVSPYADEWVVDQPVAQDGRLEAELAPGRYGLMVRDGHGQGWHEQIFEVTDDPVALWVEVPVVRISGQVRLGDEPLEARLVFQRQGTLSVTLETDEEGEYSGMLPGEGNWRVGLASDRPPVQRTFRRISVEPGPGRRGATVDFDLPDTRLFGEVVDESGNPVARAIVNVSVPEGDETSIRKDVDNPGGRFEIYGLPEGEAVLQAEAGRRQSDPAHVLVEDDLEPPLLRLVVRDNLQIRGRVVDEHGAGVPGALLTPRGLQQLHFWIPQATSGADGSFLLHLPPNESEILLNVQAPGHALRMLRVPIRTDQDLVVPVASGGGTLTVHLPAPGAPGEDPSLDLFLLHGGVHLGLGSARSWAARAGRPSLDPARVDIPDLEPGAYELCRLTQPELALALLSNFRPDACTDGFLTEGGVLELEAPAPPSDPEASG